MPRFYIIYADGVKVGEFPFRHKKDVRRLKNKKGIKIEIYDSDTENIETLVDNT